MIELFSTLISSLYPGKNLLKASLEYLSLSKDKPKSLDELDPKLLETYKKLGIPLQEQKRLNGIAVDAVFDSVSVATTFKETLTKQGIIFCSISEAVQKHPELVKKYLGTVIPLTDHFFATLNSAVFTDGSFVYIPPGVRCPMELSTYFRINASDTGQFERTLIIADKGSYVSYLEGCTAPMRDENQLHAANVELIALDDAEIKYSTVQNWYPGDKDGKGGIYNFVTKRGLCKGTNSKISWTQVETGSAITWKYPSCILKGDNSIGEFYSIAITNNHQKADTGTKMIHLGKNTKSKIISKGISAGFSDMTYRGLVDISPNATNSNNFTQCDSLLMGNKCGAHTVPYIKNKNADSNIAHEATTSKITTVFTSHAKPLVKKYKFIKGFEGGSLDFYSISKNKKTNSNLKLYDFKLNEVPALTKLLTLASLQGIADLLSGEGIRFNEFEMKFNKDKGLMTIEEIYSLGPSISVLMDGYIQKDELTSLRGTLVPATTINKVIGSIPLLGDILVGKKAGEGVFGVSFKIKGYPKDLKTTVNPIKTLTPRFITRTLEKVKKSN